MGTEKTSVEDHLVAEVERRGGTCPKVERARAGFPDRMVLASFGRVVFVETKAPDGRVSTIQKRMHRMLRALGFRVEVIWSRAEVDTFISEFFSC